MINTNANTGERIKIIIIVLSECTGIDLDNFKCVFFLSISFNLFQFVLNLMFSVRRVVIEQKQWKDGIKVVGGRGRGLFIKSESTTSRINTGDQILQVSGCGYVCMGVTLFTIW